MNKASTESPKVEGESPEAIDVALLRKAAGGDARAFHGLIDRHSARLYRVAISLVGNATDAEDVLQEASIGAFRGLKKFESRSTVATWLMRILVIQAAKWRRDRGRARTAPLENADQKPVGDSPDAVDAIAARMDLDAALQMLSAEHQQVLVLREIEQLSYEEIAAVLEVPRGTVESRLHRARLELRDRLKGYLS